MASHEARICSPSTCHVLSKGLVANKAGSEHFCDTDFSIHGMASVEQQTHCGLQNFCRRFSIPGAFLAGRLPLLAWASKSSRESHNAKTFLKNVTNNKSLV